MEFKELEYERLKQERAIRSEIRKLDEELATVKKKFKEDKAALVKKLGELEKELESGALQPGLFEGESTTEAQRHGEIKYPEKEEQLTVAGRQSTAAEIVKPRMARGKAKGDTMKVERTLLTVFPVCEYVKNNPEMQTGCCQCQVDNGLCVVRICEFGNAIECKSSTACSKDCPRAIQKEDVEAVKNNKEQLGSIKFVSLETFKKAEDLISAGELINNKARGIIKFGLSEEYIANGGCFGGGVDEVHICLVRPACDWTDPTFTYSDLCCKWSKDEETRGSSFGQMIIVKGKKYVICGPTVIIKKISDQIQFRGDYNPCIHGSQKQIRFIKPGMSGWGKPLKLTNEEQYYERMEMFRKDPNYRES